MLLLITVSARGGDLASAVAAWTNGPFVSYTGDSIAEGHPFYHSVQHLGPSGDTNFDIAGNVLEASANLVTGTNFGHGSQSFATILRDDVDHALATKPKYLLVHCGVNDVSGGRAWRDVLANLNTLKAQCAASNAILILDDMFPWSNGTDAQALTVRTWNTNFTTWADTNGVYRLISHDYFGTNRVSTGYLDNLSPLYNYYGVHINAAGYDLWANLILTSLVNFESTAEPLVFTGVTALQEGRMRLDISGPAGRSVTIYSSPDLVGWQLIATVANPTGILQFTNTSNGSLKSEFYRAVIR